MTKYDYRRLGKYLFRICFEKYDDTTFGTMIRYEIQEPADAPRNRWERFKQFFTVKSYHFGYWIPSLCDDTLDERIAEEMAFVVESLNTEAEAKKAWEAL